MHRSRQRRRRGCDPFRGVVGGAEASRRPGLAETHIPWVVRLAGGSPCWFTVWMPWNVFMSDTVFISESVAASQKSAERYLVREQGRAVSYDRAIELWSKDEGFRTFFTGLLASCGFDAFRWETPLLTRASGTHPFEFALVEASDLAARSSDPGPFRSHFVPAGASEGVVCFPSLGGDAELVVPSPRSEGNVYGHLAAFLRLGPAEQQDAFWRVLGQAATRVRAKRPVWINTAGAGVAWLHGRLDSRPKYYRYADYRRAAC